MPEIESRMEALRGGVVQGEPVGVLYHYRGMVTAVYDGDTVTVDVDLGFGVWLRGEKVRLRGINAPEVRGDQKTAGLEARRWLRERLVDRPVLLRTYRDRKEKFGRWLADVWIVNGDDTVGMCVNTAMVEAGHAVPYMTGESDG